MSSSDNESDDNEYDESTEMQHPSKRKKVQHQHSQFTQTHSQQKCDIGTQTDNCILDCSDSANIDFEPLNAHALYNVAYALGKSQHKAIKNDCMKASSEKDILSLLNLDVKVYIQDRSPVLTGFLLGMSNRSNNLQDSTHTCSSSDLKYLYSLCKTVESILNLSSGQYIMPLHFKESILIFSITGSRLALSIMSAAHGSYMSVKRFLGCLGEETSENNLPGDLVYTFDNNQVLHRNWNVNLEKKFQCHIVTMVVQFVIKEDGNVQWSEDTKPGMWILKHNDETKKVRLIDQEKSVKKIHYDQQLYPLLVQMITEVAGDQKEKTYNEANKESDFRDEIDELVTKETHTQNFKQCYKCGELEIPKTKIKCPKCKENLKKAMLESQGLTEFATWDEKKCSSKQHSTESKQYKVSFRETNQDVYRLELENTEPPQQACTINKSKVMKPIFVNPCSYDACVIVLRNIGRKGRVKRYGGDREFLIVCCDGSPYVLCCRIILSMYICNECNESVTGAVESTSHIQQHSDNNEECEMSQEFDWVLLVPGPGHLEMNMVRSFVELCWDIFWKPLVQLLNFKSENALRSAKKVSDHHKGWQLCIVAREAIVKELLVPWVRIQLNSESPDLSPDCYMKFLMSGNVQNQTYTMIAELVFELLDSIFLYRKGIRGANSDQSFAARAKIAKIWSGRSHPSYRELEMTDSIHLSRMPPEVKHLVLESWSLNTSGKLDTNEGADFKLEEVNKQVQAWLPKVPSGNDWNTVCANYDTLSKLRSTTMSQMGISDYKSLSVHKRKGMTNEIQAFRVLLRGKEYLLHPVANRGLFSLDGDKLSDEMGEFCQLARDKRAKFFDAFLESEVQRTCSRKKVPFTERPVFVTCDEERNYESLTSKTIVQLKALIYQKLQQVIDPDVKITFENALQGKLQHESEPQKSSKMHLVKSDFIDLLTELKEYLDYQDQTEVLLGNADSDED